MTERVAAIDEGLAANPDADMKGMLRIHQERMLIRLGFLIIGRASQPGVLIGHIAIERLDLLQTSKAVSFIAPHQRVP